MNAFVLVQGRPVHAGGLFLYRDASNGREFPYHPQVI